MKRIILFSVTIFSIAAGTVRAQALEAGLFAPDKAVATVNQSLDGLWLSELRRPGPTGLSAPIPAIVQFTAAGQSISAPSDPSQTPSYGVWLRVGDRKFLGTSLFFVFDSNKVLINVVKLRINYSLAADGKTLYGTSEANYFDPAGKLVQVFPGAQFTMTRVNPEIPADFYEFQKLP